MVNKPNHGNDVNFLKDLVETVKTATKAGIQKGILFILGFALLLTVQTFWGNNSAIAAPIASMDAQAEGQAIVEKSQNAAKDAGDRAREIAKNVKQDTENNFNKAKNMASDRANQIKNDAKDLPESAGNKVEEMIDSVKNFLGK